MQPVRSQVYTLHTILTQLSLQDSPILEIWVGEEKTAIQDSHVCAVELLAVPGWSELRFTYLRTTDEWIPIFRIASEDEAAVLELVTVENEINYKGEREPDQYWVVPKAFPREQDYADRLKSS